MTDATTTTAADPSLPAAPTSCLADLRARFAPLFERIREGAVERELASGTPGDRPLPHDEVRALADAGFGRLRVPTDRGGFGATLVELTHLVADLAAADSNIAHLWRGHFGYTELVLLRPSSPGRDEWLQRIVDGAIIGNATSERTGTTLADISTTVRPSSDPDGDWRLDGRKFYSTGTLYSDWIYLAADRSGERVTFAVPADAPGVTGVDDWDGFGQRLTASGTTVFDDVAVDPSLISAYRDASLSHIQAFYQLYLLAVLAGIGQAVADDAVAFVRPRTRTYIHANAATPGADPQILAVIGRLSAGAFTARSLVVAAAGMLDEVVATNVPGSGVDHGLLDGAENAVYQAQIEIGPRVLRSASELFEVGGASAADRTRALDRHWRNARVVASHNPAVYKERLVGEYALHGRGPVDAWERYHEVGPTKF
ncbi:alkylation response protein AidB-like acyl-CoA dehydrogenase [Curtobacterium pusillum]|uniref:Alkylation response protein AidB-like acyl-CoA dehydrogenase n=1 Tax=Curtobacterium pusillum TaxID=69373 RepID=A0AAW3T8N1_9MICO|nr:acyl-CoA dehydrogenase family protein [Curtobacterium pusillum]MBA8991355.1 alkylation response protein AidB-like acyl-CoA dehydrogenase [Curtobacterium pusillum]